MKDLSFFLLKNTLGSKMKKGIRNFCNGDGSTSTLNQQHKPTTTTTDHDHDHDHFSNSSPPLITSPYNYLDNIITADLAKSPPTLEEMIMELELEEENARKAKRHQEYYYGDHQMQRRMSCVNNSDILRSARNALNQYPRFSLDGKDAMYRSSFRNLGNISTTAGRKSICCNNINGGRDRLVNNGSDQFLPSTLAGESVVWCKPGVVAKLMGLEAVPVVIRSNRSRERFISSIVKKQNMRRMAERHEMERRSSSVVMGLNGCGGIKRGTTVGSCSKTGYCVMKPIAVEPVDVGVGWRPTRRFV